ncbi:exocyst complex component exo70 [Bachmanniomyces sp. S44760]|nr:exocyst complex component exo70 [Bachmanniomyces sp. S44760]
MPAKNAAFAEDSAEVEVLFAEAEKWGAISKKIKTSLDRMNANGDVLRQAAGPGYSSTQSSQVMLSNIDRLLAATEKLRRPMESRANEDAIIRGGISNVGLPKYLASLNRVDNSLAQMTATKLRVNQDAINEMTRLGSYGNAQLQDLFRSILTEATRVVEPLSYITKQLPFPTIPQNKVLDLGNIDKFVSSFSARTASYNQRDSSTVRIYSEIRGPYIAGSLQNLAAASVTTSKGRTQGEIYKQGTSGVSTYATAIEGIFIAEHGGITAIFGRDEWGSAFIASTAPALAELSKAIREINSIIKTKITTDCFLAYEIMEILSATSFRLDAKTGQLKQQFADLMKPIRETAKASLSELLEDVRRRISVMQVLPTNGASIPFTSETMTRLQNLANYPGALHSVTASLGDGGWNNPSAATGSTTSLTKSFDVGADGRQLLAHYIYDTIELLLSSLEARARPLLKGAKSLIGIFIANNASVIDRMILSSDLYSTLDSKTTSSKLDAWRKRGINAYLVSWNEIAQTLMDVQYTNRGARPPSGTAGAIDSVAVVKGLSSKDKDMIKTKFTAFNTRFDQLCATHNQMAMERDIKSAVADEIHRMVEALYARFWDRYHEIDKGKGKYVKYDKGSLAAALAALG